LRIFILIRNVNYQPEFKQKLYAVLLDQNKRANESDDEDELDDIQLLSLAKNTENKMSKPHTHIFCAEFIKIF
jgi:hypothetical protein